MTPETCPGCEKRVASDEDWKRDHDDDHVLDLGAPCWCYPICWNGGGCEPPDGWPETVVKLRAEVARLNRVLNDVEARKAAEVREFPRSE